MEKNKLKVNAVKALFIKNLQTYSNMNFTCHHWRSTDVFFEAERDGLKQNSLVQSVQDFKDGYVFYVSFRGAEFYPSHLNQSGHVLELEIDVSKVYICSSFKEYIELTDIDTSNGYLLYKASKKCLKLIEQGYELIVRGDRLDDLSEGFLVDPKKSVKSITITEVALDKKAIIDKLFNNRVNTKAKKSKPNELFPNFEDLLNIDLSFFKKSAEDDVKGVFIMKKDDTEVGLF